MESKLQTIPEDTTTNTNTNTTNTNHYPEFNGFIIPHDTKFDLDTNENLPNEDSHEAILVLKYKHTNKMTKGIKISGSANKNITITACAGDIEKLKIAIAYSTVPTIPYEVYFYEQGLLNVISNQDSNITSHKQTTTLRGLYQMNTLLPNQHFEHILLLTSAFDPLTERHTQVVKLNKMLHEQEIQTFFEMNPCLENVVLYITEELSDLYGVELLQSKFKEVRITLPKDNIIDTIVFDYWGFTNGAAVIPSMWTVHPDLSTFELIRTFRNDLNYVEGSIRPTQRSGYIQFSQDIQHAEGISVYLIKTSLGAKSINILISHTDDKTDSKMSVTINVSDFTNKKYHIDIGPLYDGLLFSRDWEDYNEKYKTMVVKDAAEEEQERYKLFNTFSAIVAEIIESVTRFDIYHKYKKLNGSDMADILTDKQVASPKSKEYIKVTNHLINYGASIRNSLLDSAFAIIRTDKNFTVKKKSDKTNLLDFHISQRQCAQNQPTVSARCAPRSITRTSNKDDE